MAEKKQSGKNWLQKIFVAIIPFVLNITYYLKYVIKQEAKRALKNLSLLILLCSFAGVLLASAWICLQALIYTYLISLNLSPIISLFIVLLITIIIFVITCFFIIKTKSKLTRLLDKIDRICL